MMEKKKLVEGPVSLIEYYSDKFEKHIYLFGDEHIKKSTCRKNDSITVDDFFKNVIDENSDKMIDVFIEITFVSAKTKPTLTTGERFDIGEAYLTDIRKAFRDCLQIDKTTCQYKNARFHYIDIRTINPVLEAMLVIGYTITKAPSEMFKEQVWKIFEWLGDIKETKATILNITKIKRQLDNIKNTELRNRIEEYIDNWMNIYASMQSQVTKYLKTAKIDQNWTLSVASFFTGFVKFLMDMYTTSRMMRTFSDGSSPKFILYYGGYGHIKNIN